MHSIRENNTKPHQETKSRDVVRTYMLHVEGRVVRVCMNYLDTLSIGRKTVDVAPKKSSHGIYSGADKCGKHVLANKTTDKAVDLVKEPINSFRLIESHWIRKTSQTKYIVPGLSIQKMFEL